MPFLSSSSLAMIVLVSSCVSFVIPQPSCDNSRLPRNLLAADETQVNGSTTSGGWLRVRCESNSRLRPGPYLSCRNGQWRGNAHCIRVECPNMSPPENGEKTGSNHGYNDEVSFICHDDFILDGVSNLRCQSDLTWSTPPPICKAISEVCTVPLGPANGRWIKGSNCRDGRYQLQGCQLSYTCNEGYTPASSNVVYVCSEPEWDQVEEPLCNPGSCDNSNLPGLLEKYEAELDDFTDNGYWLRIRCKNDLQLYGSHFLACRNGEWHGNSWCRVTK